MEKIIFSKCNNPNEIQKMHDMGIEIFDDKNIFEIKDKSDLFKSDDKIVINCKDINESFQIATKITNNKILKCEILTPHIAYIAFSTGFNGILCDMDNINKNGGGKFIHKINLAYKKAKNDRFYFNFFKSKMSFTQIRNTNIDRIFKSLDADSIALDLDNPHLKTFLYVLKNKNIIKIGIVKNKEQFKIARNLLDESKLDAIELESSNDLKYANFAFYNKSNPVYNMKIVD